LIEGRAAGDEWVSLEVWSPPDLSRPTWAHAQKQEFKKTHVGESFGPSWSTHWFRITIVVPEYLQKMDHLEFHWDANNEGLIYKEDGEIVHGLTGGGERPIYIFPKSWYDGKPHLFYIEMACNHMFGNAFGDNIQPPPTDRYYQLLKADIVAVNLEVRALNIDFWEIGDAAREFPGDSWESHRAFTVCNKIMDEFIAGKGSKEAIAKCRATAREYFGQSVDTPKIYDGPGEVVVTAIGHCHIDTCWLWPWAETKRKVARSWSNQLDNIERYPEFRFCCSQAQQFKWLEMYHPRLFDRVKTKVKEGKFHPVGGSWVEHDTNMPSGESLSRQFIYGQRFFESRFGERCKTFWLPDTFGYSAQLPQLCRLAGMSRFFTQKLSWNNINSFPHTTFNWVSLDGTQVLCHMTPAETYTAEANFGDLKRSYTQHKTLDQDPTSLLVFGKGDGGGGPTYEHIEKLRRIRAIADNTNLLPRVKLGDSVEDFFDQLQKKVKKGVEFPTWYGELYFELHRGTYTTQANNKRNNRKAEFLLRTVEYLSTLATLQLDKSSKTKTFKYPKKDIDFMWEGVLLCQFHDCLPGSSIEMCYDDSNKLYEEIFNKGEAIVEEALQALGFDDKNLDSDLVPVSFTPWEWNPLVEVSSSDPNLPPSYGVAIDGRIDFEHRPINDRGIHVKELRKGAFEMVSERARVLIEDGVITSLYDIKNRREVIAKGAKANQFVIFDDKPIYWQAWDVEVYHLESRQELSSTESYITESSAHRVSVTSVTRISELSSLKSTISMDVGWHDSMQLVHVEVDVDWHENKKFLKVEFPVDVTSSVASYESQYGFIQRPTHYNTSWDMAKFEVCCHKWADLSESDYGVAILNDSKYGFATCGNVMRLSLLRAPKAPDAHADMGTFNPLTRTDH
jgi:alpha-mannosidase